MTITSSDLPKTLASHDAWLRGEDSGNRANLSGADLSDADLYGADLSGADLSDADLYGARGIVDAGHRADGYRFVGYVKDNVIMIRAGCRNFTMEKARKNWFETRNCTSLGDETTVLLDHIQSVMEIRSLILTEKATA